MQRKKSMNQDQKRGSLGEPAKTHAVSTLEQATLSDTAHVFGAIVGSTQPLGVLMEAMRVRLEALRDPTSDEALAELQRTMPTLEALYLRFSTEAANSRKGAVHQALLLRAALQAQQAYARTFALLHTLALQAKNADRVLVDLRPEQ
jgi:hypothetical protein